MPVFSTGSLTETQYMGAFAARSMLDSIQGNPERGLYAFYGHTRRPSKSRSIAAIERGNPTVFVVPGHGLTTLNQIAFHSIDGMSELLAEIGTVFGVSVIDENRFSIELDSTGFALFQSGTVDFLDMQSECGSDFDCSERSVAHIWKNMLGIKRVNGNDVSLVIPRVPYVRGKMLADWNSQLCYTKAEVSCDCHADQNLRGDSIYVTSAGNVYQCVSNGGFISIVEPDQLSPYEFQTTDGYRWQYLFSVNLSSNKFVTPEWIPVLDLCVDNGTSQWDAIEAAEFDGRVVGIDIIHAGSNFVNGTFVFPIRGDGYGGSAEIVVVGGKVSSARVIETGAGYSWADVVMLSDSDHAVFSLQIEPTITFAKNSFISASACRLMVVFDFDDDESSQFMTGNSYCSYGLLYSPREVNCEFAAGPVYDLRTRIGISTTPAQFVLNEALNSLNNRMTLTQISGSNLGTLQVLAGPPKPLSLGSIITGETSGLANTISSIVRPSILYGSGAVIAYELMQSPITRNASQRERYRIILEF